MIPRFVRTNQPDRAVCDGQFGGLDITYDTGVFRRQDDDRVADLAVYCPDRFGDRGAEGAALVVEIRSPGDESMAKIPWYLAKGCREVLIVDRDSLEVELHGPGGRPR